jgi:imidazolonepropionase-like amidohydrolase
MAILLAASAYLRGEQPAPKTIVLKAARLFDARSDSLRRDAVIVVVGDRISSVGGAAPAGATVLDLGDVTLLPGFIDAHTHLTAIVTDDYNRGFYEYMTRQPTEQVLLASTYARATLEAGFTTVRDLGTTDALDIGLRNGIANGWVPGPRMLIAVHAIGSIGGHADDDAFPAGRHIPQQGPADGICSGPAECRAAVRYQLKYGADVIKVMASGGVTSPNDPLNSVQFSTEELAAIVDEAHHWGKKVAAHCHPDAAARQAVEAGVDSIEHGSFVSPSTLALMKQKGTYLDPTLLAMVWTREHASAYTPAMAVKAKAANEAAVKAFHDALASGVKIAFGTDSAVSPHGLNARQFAIMTGFGMSPAAALRSATAVNADLLGIADRLGTIEPGKLADIVAVPGNPLEDIRQTEHVVFVMKGGEIVKGGR